MFWHHLRLYKSTVKNFQITSQKKVQRGQVWGKSCRFQFSSAPEPSMGEHMMKKVSYIHIEMLGAPPHLDETLLIYSAPLCSWLRDISLWGQILSAAEGNPNKHVPSNFVQKNYGHCHWYSPKHWFIEDTEFFYLQSA